MKHKVCSNSSLNKDWLEAQVLKSVLNTVMTKEQIERISQLVFEELQSLQDKPKSTVADLKKERKSLVAKQERLTDLYLDGDLEKTMLDAKNAELREKTHDIDKELEKLKAVEELNGIKKDTIYNYLLRYFERLKNDNSLQHDEFMRAVFSSFVEKVVISESKITVDVITDFSIMDVGDNERLAGAIRRLSPVELRSFIPRKKSPFGRNEINPIIPQQV